MSSVYNGQRLAGTVERRGAGYTAFDAGGRVLGVFATQLEAVRAVLSPPPAPMHVHAHVKSGTDIELRAALTAMAKSG